MNEISKKIIMDEIKGLMSGISAIVSSSAMVATPMGYSNDSAVTASSVSEITTKAKSIKAYVAKIEEKTKLLEEDLASDNTEVESDQTITDDLTSESNE